MDETLEQKIEAIAKDISATRKKLKALPPGREVALAITKLEESAFWLTVSSDPEAFDQALDGIETEQAVAS